MKTILLLIVIISFLSVNVDAAVNQFQTYCTGGCVQPAAYWKNVTWPSGTVSETTQFCGSTALSIVQGFQGDTLANPDILVQYIVANLNKQSGACATPSAIVAINTVKNAINGASCANGVPGLQSQLTSSVLSSGRNLYNYNNGNAWGPCPCTNLQCRF